MSVDLGLGLVIVRFLGLAFCVFTVRCRDSAVYAVYAVVMCLSVCLSVCHKSLNNYHTK